MENKNKFAIHTLGCKVNTYESEVMINDLLMEGYIQVDFDQKADIYIINTCTVTNMADSKSRNIISRAHKLNPEAIIVVAGCYAQTSSEEILKKLKVDIIIGNKYKKNIVNLINEFKSNKTRINKVENLMLEKEFEDETISSFESRTRAFLKIQDGCNFMCSYCTIPFARGRQRSANIDNLINQIKDFINKGFKEIVLTGVNTAGYEYQGYKFIDLLKRINEIEGNFRIRISSVEPFQISDEIINLICSNPHRFCNHWHLCLQSGSNEILKKMNRKYTSDEFLNIMNKIKQKSPLASISTDLIVGFPTETQEQHNESMNFIKNAGFSFFHIFPYSKRNNTAASKLKDINGTIKKQRFEEANKINHENYKNYLKQFINNEVIVLFEKNENGIYHGKTSEYANVLFKSNDLSLNNKFIKAKVKSVINNTLIIDDIEVLD